MEYIYAILLLHNAKKEITSDAVKAILKGAGIEADEGKLKGLIQNLSEVDIQKAIDTAAVAVSASAPVAEKKEEKKEEVEEKVSEETAAEGLSSLFG